jgi:hypothetical protein
MARGANFGSDKGGFFLLTEGITEYLIGKFRTLPKFLNKPSLVSGCKQGK